MTTREKVVDIQTRVAKLAGVVARGDLEPSARRWVIEGLKAAAWILSEVHDTLDANLPPDPRVEG